jgi:hypothetical protein
MPKTNVQELENFEPPKYEFEVKSMFSVPSNNVLFVFFLGKITFFKIYNFFILNYYFIYF